MTFQKIDLSQFKITIIASAIIISGIGIFSTQIPQAQAQGEPFIGEIVFFGGNFAPRGWAFCDGQLLPISQNAALFSILGTTYGGDGRTTFALPDARGRVLIHPGNGPGLSNYNLGQRGGAETNTLTVNQLPSHSHTVNVPVNNDELGTETNPDENYLGKQWRRGYHATSTADDSLAQFSSGSTGGGQSVNNVQPYVTANCIIAIQGIFPSRN